MRTSDLKNDSRKRNVSLFNKTSVIMSVPSSIKVIDGIVDQYREEISQLDIPDFTTPSSSYKNPTVSPYVNEFKLNRIINDIPSIKLQLNKYKGNKAYQDVSEKILLLQSLLDEKSYINDKLIRIWVSSKTVTGLTDKANETAEDKTTYDETIELNDDEENFVSLRKRLLSGGTHTSLDDTTNNKPSIDKANTYHESIQEDILSELTGFAASLRQSAVTLSSKLLNDNAILNKTGDNLMKNETLMKSVGNNLNNYVTNKSGGKISFWFLLKILLASFVLFFAMVVLIKIFPKM